MKFEENLEEKKMTSPGFVARSSLIMIKHQPLLFVLVTLSSIFFFITPLGLALITREIFNQLTGVPSLEFSIWTLVWLIPVMYVVQLITDITFTLFVWRFNLMNKILLRKNMIRGIFKQPGADALEKSPGEAISRFRGDTEEAVWFTSLIGDINAFFMFAIIAFVLMYKIDATVTLVIFFPFIIVVTIINSSSKKLTKYRSAARKASGRVTGAVGENFGAIQAIKVASAEQNVLNHFERLNNDRRTSAVKDSALSAGLRSTGKIVVSISTGVILLLVGSKMQNGSFTFGDFTLFIFLLNWLTGFIRFLGEFLAWFQRNRVSYERMLRIMQGKSNFPDEKELMTITPLYLKENYPNIIAKELATEDRFDALRIENLSYIFEGTDNGIERINFEIKRGTFNVIVGRIGSGKTTLLRTILGLLPKQSGEIYWNDKPIKDPSNFLVSPKIAYTSQIPVLFSTSIKENILMGLNEDAVNFDKAIDFANVKEEIESFENKEDTKVGPKGILVSGGQKHRIAAARMFVREPEIFVFDDLSSALDVKTEEELWEKLFANSDSTFLVTSHRKYVLNRADKIIILKDGAIHDVGTIKELLERSEEMRNLWEGKSMKHEITTSVEIYKNSQIIKNTKTKYPNYLISQMDSKISHNWQFRNKFQEFYKNLVDFAFEDNEITIDEKYILERIIEDIHLYGELLNKALKGGIVNEAEKLELMNARNEIYKKAVKQAENDDIISDEEQSLLDRISEILESIDEIRINAK